MAKKLNYKMFEKIPSINRDGPLLSRLATKTITGFDSVLDKESRLYLRFLARLTDKAFDEYGNTRNCLLKEIKTRDKFMLRFKIINHFENCINAVNRVGKVLDTTKNGNGQSKLDKNGHMIIDHDLHNHDEELPDRVAEKFINWAESENLSFWKD